MSHLHLTLARIFTRVDFAPKSLLYHDRRALFGARYYPDPYGGWQINPKQLRLASTGRRWLLTLDGDSVTLRADRPEEIQEIQQHCTEVFADFLDEMGEGTRVTRIGWRGLFVTEHTSFEELFPRFRDNMVRHERSWMRLPEMKVRDLGFVNVQYGPHEDGLNLSTGVLVPAQVEDYLLKDPIPGLPEETGMAIEDGCLFIDLDRYQVQPDGVEITDQLTKWHGQLESLAGGFMEKLLAS